MCQNRSIQFGVMVMTDKKSDIPGLADAFQRAREAVKRAEDIPISPSATQDFPGRNATPVFANQYYISVGPHTARLTLGEYAFNGQIPNWFFTTVMTTPVAIDSAHKILKLANDAGVSIDEIKEPDVLG